MQVRDLTGQKFGRLTVIARRPAIKGDHVAWRCLCDCGREHVATGNNLVRGKVGSCGCAKAEANRRRCRKAEAA